MLVLQPSRLVNSFCLSEKLTNCLSLLSHIPEYLRAKREPLFTDITGVLSWLGNENRAVLSLHFRIIVSKQAGVRYSCKHSHRACLPEMFLFFPSVPAVTPDFIPPYLRMTSSSIIGASISNTPISLEALRGSTHCDPVVPQSCSYSSYLASLGRLYSGQKDIASHYRHVHQFGRTFVV